MDQIIQLADRMIKENRLRPLAVHISTIFRLERMIAPPLKLQLFLGKVFSGITEQAQPGCWVSKALNSERPELNNLSAAIEIVERYDQLEALTEKLKREHPLDKPHQRQYDHRVLDVLTEACAFAWADLRKLGSPKFSDAEGTPDVYLDTGYWVEAKAIHSSKEDAELTQRMIKGYVAGGAVTQPAPGLFNKLGSALGDATGKFNRQRGDNNVVFLNVTIVDLPQIPIKNQVLGQIKDWADGKELTDPSVSIVLCHSYNWQEPVRDPFVT